MSFIHHLKSWLRSLWAYFTRDSPIVIEYRIEINADGFYVKSAARVAAWVEKYSELEEKGVLSCEVRKGKLNKSLALTQGFALTEPSSEVKTGQDAVAVLNHLPVGFLVDANVHYYQDGHEVLAENMQPDQVSRVIMSGKYTSKN